MDTKWIPVIVTAISFLITFGGGYWLSKLGKPYNQVLLAVHKLVPVGTLVYLGVVIAGYAKVKPFTDGQIAALAVAAFLFIATIVNGALVSLKKEMPAVVKKMHKVMPYMTLMATGLLIFLFFN